MYTVRKNLASGGFCYLQVGFSSLTSWGFFGGFFCFFNIIIFYSYQEKVYSIHSQSYNLMFYIIIFNL